MQLDPYLVPVHEHLLATAALGDDRTHEIADALATAAVPAVRLALLSAVSEVAAEVTAALLDHPGSPAVTVRIDGDEVAVEVRTVANTSDVPQSRPADADASARISLRLTESLKADIDTAAERDRISVNTWLLRAADDALRAGGGGQAGRGRDRRDGNQHHVTGWING